MLGFAVHPTRRRSRGKPRRRRQFRLDAGQSHVAAISDIRPYYCSFRRSVHQPCFCMFPLALLVTLLCTSYVVSSLLVGITLQATRSISNVVAMCIHFISSGLMVRARRPIDSTIPARRTLLRVYNIGDPRITKLHIQLVYHSKTTLPFYCIN